MTQPYDGPPEQADPSPPVDSFGDAGVDRAVERLAELPDLPVADHVEVFDDIHQRLRDTLESASVDTSPP